MLELSRRQMLAGSASAVALSAASTLPMPAEAAAPPAAKQNVGFYRYKLGTFEVTVVTDGAATIALPDNFVRNAKKEEVEAQLRASYVDPAAIRNTFTPVVINTGSKLVAIDTGNGPAAHERTKGAIGQYQANLAASGIDAKAIDAVIISHFHGDHMNGLLSADNKPLFPNAEILVPASEFAWWMDEGNVTRTPEYARGNFANAKRVIGSIKVTQYQDGKEIVPGITALATPGHTPGHTSAIVSSGNASLLVQADATTVPALFLKNPGWHVAFDTDPNLAEATRLKLLDRVASDKMMMQAYHFPFPATGYLDKDGGGFRWVPIAWNPNI